MNIPRTALLLAALTALFLLGGAALSGGAGILIALVIAIATNAFAYWTSVLERRKKPVRPMARRSPS